METAGSNLQALIPEVLPGLGFRAAFALRRKTGGCCEMSDPTVYYIHNGFGDSGNGDLSEVNMAIFAKDSKTLRTWTPG